MEYKIVDLNKITDNQIKDRLKHLEVYMDMQIEFLIEDKYPLLARRDYNNAILDYSIIKEFLSKRNLQKEFLYEAAN